MNNETKELCIEMYALLQTPRDFEVGDFVTWKHPVLAYKKIPKVGESLIVTEIFDPIRNVVAPAGSQYFYEPLDMKLGMIDEAGDFTEYVTDSRRFKKSD